MVYTLTHHAYCGMPIPLLDVQEEANHGEARMAAARRIRAMRREGFPVATREKGERWEILCPDDAFMVPDCCGELVLRERDLLAERYGACRECGSDSDWTEDPRGGAWCNCQRCMECDEVECCCWAREEEG